MAIKIPDAHVPMLRLIAGLPEDRLVAVLKALQELKPALYDVDLAPEFAKQSGLEERQAEQILTVLTSMYAHLGRREESPETFSAQVCESLAALRVVESRPTAEALDRLGRFLPQLLSVEPLGITSKAIGVMQENSRVYLESRVISDLRPVFRADVRLDPAGVMVVHNLKIVFQEGLERREFFVALDRDDLSALREVLERAALKEATLRRFLAAKTTPHLDGTTHVEK